MGFLFGLGALFKLGSSIYSGIKSHDASVAEQKLYKTKIDQANEDIRRENAALDYNASMLEQQAADVLEMTEYQAELIREQIPVLAEQTFLEESTMRRTVENLTGSQRSGFAGSGVVIGAGSAADVVAETQMFAEADILTLRRNELLTMRAIEETAYQTQRGGYYESKNLLSRSELMKRQKRKELGYGDMPSDYSTAGSILTGVADVANYGLKYGKDIFNPKDAGKAVAKAVKKGVV